MTRTLDEARQRLAQARRAVDTLSDDRNVAALREYVRFLEEQLKRLADSPDS